MENGPFVGDLLFQIVSFHSYIELPEGSGLFVDGSWILLQEIQTNTNALTGWSLFTTNNMMCSVEHFPNRGHLIIHLLDLVFQNL